MSETEKGKSYESQHSWSGEGKPEGTTFSVEGIFEDNSLPRSVPRIL